jgi:diadenosine tetraphosphate (Ap4A) HIT family hydrolase
VTVGSQCPLCALVDSGAIVINGGLAVAVADAYPLNPGHHLVLTRRHEPDFFALHRDEIDAVMSVAFEVQQHIRAKYQPDGFNVGVNVGDAAGQTIDHVHLHVIPRYRGDVADPRGGIRWIVPARAAYWEAAAPPDHRPDPPGP